MEYRLDNRHSLGFMLRRMWRGTAEPFIALRDMTRSVDRDIRLSEAGDFNPFSTRGFDPERSRSLFA